MPGQGRHRRHYASEEDEGASSFAASRGDKTSSDTHTRSNHNSRHSEKNRTSSPSKIDMRDDAASSSSRTHPENDERRITDDQYDYSPSKDGRHRGRRDDHDYRAKDSYPNSRDSHYSSPGKQRADNHDQDRDYDDSREDTSAWTPRKDSWWAPKEKQQQGGQRNDRRRGGFGFEDRFTDTRSRDESNPQEWRRDNGWASRRAMNGDAGSHAVQSTTSERPPDERGGYSHAPTQQGSNRNDSHRKHRKKHKKQKPDKRPREWRPANDDTHLNKCVPFTLPLSKANLITYIYISWTRRDNAEYSRKTQKSEQKRYRSPSRSRSPESYYSRRSSRGRSHSSEAPRRRRADSRGGRSRSRSPYDRPGKGPPRRWSRSPSRSPPRRYGRSPMRSPPRSPWSPAPRRPRSRGRSVSTASTISRSPSRSPRERSRTVHRLPLATSAEDMRKAAARTPFGLPQKPVQEQRNGEGKGRRDVSVQMVCFIAV